MRKYRKYIEFGAAVLTWSAIIIWTQFWYLLLFNLVFLDLFITRKIDWTLRKYGLPRFLQSTLEWMAVLILAIVFSFTIKVLLIEAYKIPTPSMEETLLVGDYIFVSKLAYGPRLPGTPLSIPFYHNKLPSGQKSYSEKISLSYKRIRGFSKVKRDDIIVFNFPEGDSMVVQYPGQNYYSLVRQYGRDYILSEFEVLTHPVDKRENYIKRCIGLPGDVLIISEGEVMVNGKIRPDDPGKKHKYYVTTTGDPLPDPLLDSLKILKSSLTYNPVNSLYVLYLTTGKAEFLKSYHQVRSIKRFAEPMLSFQNLEIFPHSSDYRWTGDNFGPMKVPARGDSVQIDMINIPLYQRIIEVYENNKLHVEDGMIYINDRMTSYYKFEMDYFFVMGDNHHNSADSRYWGLVPEDHLLGKAVTVWFSIEPDKPFIEGLRKERIFSSIK
jgi:signal peptidase I